MALKCTFIPKTEIKPGHKTVLGIVTETKLSPSGKTMVITVRNEKDGHLFTDRVSAAGKMAVFTETACRYERDETDPAIRVCVTHNPDLGLYDDESCAGAVNA